MKNIRSLILGVFPFVLGGCLCLCMATGCQITTKNQGETGIRYGTEITFFSRAAQTSPEEATIKSEAPALVDWLFRKPEPKPVVVVEPTP